ncbi:MAG: hypothetical protein IKX54_05205 [Lachnospiraceae bacterium]|nr:hypothetical protein [Lachnospiraceae bacterium]
MIRKRFLIILIVGVLCVLLCACGGGGKNGSNGNDSSDGKNSSVGGENDQQLPGGESKKTRAFYDPFAFGMMMTETYAFIPAKNECGARYFDVASRTDVLFCFEPNCEHIGWRMDVKGNWYGDHCASRSLGSGAFFLADDCGYYFSWPELIRTDRQGLNQKTVAKFGEPLDFQLFELYTEEDYFTSVRLSYEHIPVDEADGSVSWIQGDRLEKEASGIVRISLSDGSGSFIFKDSDHYNASVVDLYAYQNHLYFCNHYLDVPFETLVQYNDDASNWEEVVLDQRKHSHMELYDYDIASGELHMILRRDGDRGDRIADFRFGDGYFLETRDTLTGEGGRLYTLSGEIIRDLPWAVGDRAATDGTPIFKTWDSGVTKYRMYDIEKNEVLRELDVPDGTFNLNVAVGNSYYGLAAVSGSDGYQAAYIAAEDFWNGAFDRLVVFHYGPENE